MNEEVMGVERRMGLGLNVDRGRVMGAVITAMEACDLARVLYNKVKSLIQEEDGENCSDGEGDSSRSPRSNKGVE